MNLCFYSSIDGLTLFSLCLSVPCNISIQSWRHTVISRLNSHICSLSAVDFDCWCILCMKFCYRRYLSCHHDTWLSWVLPHITFWVGNICCMSLSIYKDDIRDVWPVDMNCWGWCAFEGLWCESFKEEVQLKKCGDLVAFINFINKKLQLGSNV